MAREEITTEGAALAARRQVAWELSCKGWTQQRIADHLNVVVSTVNGDLMSVRNSFTPVDVEHIRQRQVELIRIARETLFSLVERQGAPVAVGQQGQPLYDPETGEVVRDYALRVNALKELRMWADREAKLVGADAAMKIQHSGEIVVQGSVEAELESLAAELGINDPAPVEQQQ